MADGLKSVLPAPQPFIQACQLDHLKDSTACPHESVATNEYG